ncbi:AraC-like ligand-binding domain-containing protein [Corynebacterium sp. S7]
MRQGNLDFWNDRVGSHVLPFRHSSSKGADFKGEIQAINFLETNVFSMTAGDHIAERNDEIVRQDDDEYVVVTFQISGSIKMTQGGSQVLLYPGQAGLYLSNKPVILECHGDYQSRSVRIPLSRFSTSLRLWDNIGALGFDGTQGLAPHVLGFLNDLPATGDALSVSARTAVGNHLVGLVEAMLIDAKVPEELPAQPPAFDLLEHCLTYIEANLSDPELNPNMIAGASHVSVRSLHNAFKQSGMTCASYIRQRRFERVRAELALEEFVSVPIEKILQRWGVHNPSNFGQYFKRIEGCTPTEFRRRALGGV